MKTQVWRPGWTRVLWAPNGKHSYVSVRATDEPYPQLWMIAYLMKLIAFAQRPRRLFLAQSFG